MQSFTAKVQRTQGAKAGERLDIIGFFPVSVVVITGIWCF
jgi:hypothetical protein